MGMDMNNLMHKDVVLKNGVAGKIIGFCLYPEDDKPDVLVQAWTSEGKKANWYKETDFTVK